MTAQPQLLVTMGMSPVRQNLIVSLGISDGSFEAIALADRVFRLRFGRSSRERRENERLRIAVRSKLVLVNGDEPESGGTGRAVIVEYNADRQPRARLTSSESMTDNQIVIRVTRLRMRRTRHGPVAVEARRKQRAAV